MMINKEKIAVLITCHNRREKTLSCLYSLFEAKVPQKYSLEVFLVDDGSNDDTDKAVRTQFPQVKLIKGNGNMYWNKGMRLAWDTASKIQNYDYYLWLNDDTLILEFALIELLQCYHEAIEKNSNPGIISGACCADNKKLEFTYGGRETESIPIIPNGELQSCKFINGNIVLISRVIYENIGMLSTNYTHAIGDFDYGLRALQAGFNCYTTKKYVAVCPINEGIPAWCNPQTSFIKRWESMHSPKGLNIKEYNTFRRKFWGWKWIFYACKAYFRVLFPTYYLKLSGK